MNSQKVSPLFLRLWQACAQLEFYPSFLQLSWSQLAWQTVLLASIFIASHSGQAYRVAAQGVEEWLVDFPVIDLNVQPARIEYANADAKPFLKSFEGIDLTVAVTTDSQTKGELLKRENAIVFTDTEVTHKIGADQDFVPYFSQAAPSKKVSLDEGLSAGKKIDASLLAQSAGLSFALFTALFPFSCLLWFALSPVLSAFLFHWTKGEETSMGLSDILKLALCSAVPGCFLQIFILFLPLESFWSTALWAASSFVQFSYLRGALKACKADQLTPSGE